MPDKVGDHLAKKKEQRESRSLTAEDSLYMHEREFRSHFTPP
jgi:hypothetical protein